MQVVQIPDIHGIWIAFGGQRKKEKNYFAFTKPLRNST